MQAAAAKLQEIAERVVDGPFPEKVKYEPHCGALCCASTSRRHLGFQRRMLAALRKLILGLPAGRKACAAHEADTMLACEARTPGVVDAIIVFALVVAAAGCPGQPGVIRASCLMCEVVSGEVARPYQDVIRRLHRASDHTMAAAAPSHRWPL